MKLIIILLCSISVNAQTLTIKRTNTNSGNVVITREWFTDITPIDLQGQSNAEGRITYAEYPSDLQDSAQWLKIYNDDFTALQKVKAGLNASYIGDIVEITYTGLEVVMQDNLEFINKNFYFIKRTRGGVPLCPYVGSYFYYGAGAPIVTTTHAYATGVGNQYAQFIWMQGETESNYVSSSCADNYNTYLVDMITDFRGIVGQNVHVIIPRVNTALNPVTYPHVNTVSNNQILGAQEMGNAHTFSTAGLALKDAVHFNLASYYTIADSVTALILQDILRPRTQTL